MLKSDQFVQIGQVLKSNGTDGQVVIGLRGIGPEDISETEPVFVFFDELPVPFFLSGIIPRGSSKILSRLTDVNSLEDAEEMVGRAVFMPDDDSSLSQTGDFVGWKLLPSGSPATEALEITGFEDIPGNPCLEVGSTLIPFHEDLVENVDIENKTITINVPSGLL